MRLMAGCVALAALGGAACSDGATPDTGTITLPDALTCASTSWNVLHRVVVPSGPTNLHLHDGTLYMSVGSTGIYALPAGGGSLAQLTASAASRLWFEDAIYFTAGDDKLRRLPFAGGTPTLVADGMTTRIAPTHALSEAAALDGSSFYWDLTPQVGEPTCSLWRMPRGGGAAEKMADLPVAEPLYNNRVLVPSVAEIIVGVDVEGVAHAVPLSGGGLRQLPSPPPSPEPNRLLGASVAAVLWVNEEPRGSYSYYPATQLWFSDAADPGATVARPFWPDKPPGMRPMRAYPDHDGGWVVTGTEYLADYREHASVWAVDARGTGTRLGCNPTGAYNESFSGAAVTPDAVYVTLNRSGEAQGFVASVVRIDRPAGQ